MVNKIGSFLFSTRLMAVLFLSFAVAMAAGTFIENEYNTDTARIIIYNAWWFEGIMLLFAINFIGNIQKYKLWQWKKWATLTLHLSFLLILLGAFITRYISYEGQMHIREGETTNEIVTDKNFFKIQIEENGDVLNYKDIPYMMSPLHKNFKAKYDYHGKEISVKTIDFIQRKKTVQRRKRAVENSSGHCHGNAVMLSDCGRCHGNAVTLSDFDHGPHAAGLTVRGSLVLPWKRCDAV